MKKYFIAAIMLAGIFCQAQAVVPPYYRNEMSRVVVDTITWTNPAPNDYWIRGNYHLVNSCTVVKATACPEGVVLRATGTVEAKDIRGDRLFGDGSGITGIIGGASFALAADVRTATTTERTERMAADTLLAGATAQERTERLAGDTLLAGATAQERTARIAQDELIGRTTGYEYAARVAQDTLIGQATGYEQAARISQDTLIGQTTGYEWLARIVQDALIGQATGYEQLARQTADSLLGGATTAQGVQIAAVGQDTATVAALLAIEISTRAWNDNLLGQATGQTAVDVANLAKSTGITAGMVGASTGDILYYNSYWRRLARGSAGQVLRIGALVPAWSSSEDGRVSPSTGIISGNLAGGVIVSSKNFTTSGGPNQYTFFRGDNTWAIPASAVDIASVKIGTATLAEQRASDKSEIDSLHLATATERTARINQDVLIGQATGYEYTARVQLAADVAVSTTNGIPYAIGLATGTDAKKYTDYAVKNATDIAKLDWKKDIADSSATYYGINDIGDVKITGNLATSGESSAKTVVSSGVLTVVTGGGTAAQEYQTGLFGRLWQSTCLIFGYWGNGAGGQDCQYIRGGDGQDLLLGGNSSKNGVRITNATGNMTMAANTEFTAPHLTGSSTNYMATLTTGKLIDPGVQVSTTNGMAYAIGVATGTGAKNYTDYAVRTATDNSKLDWRKDVADSSGTIMNEVRVATGTDAKNYTDGVMANYLTQYSTVPIALCQVDTTTAGNLIGSYIPGWRAPVDLVIKTCHYGLSDAAGAFSAGVCAFTVSTAAAGGSYTTSFSTTSGTGTYGDFTPVNAGQTILAGTYIRIAVTNFTTAYGLGVTLDVWKR